MMKKEKLLGCLLLLVPVACLYLFLWAALGSAVDAAKLLGEMIIIFGCIAISVVSIVVAVELLD